VAARPSQLAIQDALLLGCAAAGRCSELGRLAETRACAAPEQAHCTLEPGCTRWLSKLFVAQLELGSIRFGRIGGPDWLPEDLQPNGRKPWRSMGYAADDLPDFELSGGTLGASGARGAKGWTVFKTVARTASWSRVGSTPMHLRPGRIAEMT